MMGKREHEAYVFFFWWPLPHSASISASTGVGGPVFPPWLLWCTSSTTRQPLVEGGMGESSGSSMPCLMWGIKSPGLLCALRGEWSLGYVFWGCMIASIRMKVWTKGGNMLLPFQWAYKPHFKRVVCLINCSGRVVRAGPKYLELCWVMLKA